jgi:hypothetical protein
LARAADRSRGEETKGCLAQGPPGQGTPRDSDGRAGCILPLQGLREANADCVILFGSYARGDAAADNDVDFRIIAEGQLSLFKRSRHEEVACDEPLGKNHLIL